MLNKQACSLMKITDKFLSKVLLRRYFIVYTIKQNFVHGGKNMKTRRILTTLLMAMIMVVIPIRVRAAEVAQPVEQQQEVSIQFVKLKEDYYK